MKRYYVNVVGTNYEFTCSSRKVAVNNAMRRWWKSKCDKRALGTDIDGRSWYIPITIERDDPEVKK